eukprot:jgi/Mesvir1/27569/Mv07314-RA.2
MHQMTRARRPSTRYKHPRTSTTRYAHGDVLLKKMVAWTVEESPAGSDTTPLLDAACKLHSNELTLMARELLSARLLLGQLAEGDLRARCEERGLKAKGTRRDLVRQLLHSPGEVEAVWKAMAAVLYPSKSEWERDRLVAPLMEADKAGLARMDELCQLAASENTGSLPLSKRKKVAEVAVGHMKDAREKDIKLGLLEYEAYPYPHYHKAMVAGPIALIMQQHGMREAFCGEPHLLEELRCWVKDGAWWEPRATIVARCNMLTMLAGTRLYEEVVASGEAKAAMKQVEPLQKALGGESWAFLDPLPGKRLQELVWNLESLDDIHNEVLGSAHKRSVVHKKALVKDMRERIEDLFHLRQQQEVAAKFTGIPPQLPPPRTTKGKSAACPAMGKGKDKAPHAGKAPNPAGTATGSERPTKWWESVVIETSSDESGEDEGYDDDSEDDEDEPDPSPVAAAAPLPPASLAIPPPASGATTAPGATIPPAEAPPVPGSAAVPADGPQLGADTNEPAVPKSTTVLIACYNYKGGVGKTSTAINLGFTLAETLACRTCYVDCDPQCNLTTFFNTQIKKVEDPNEVRVEEAEDDKAAPISHRDCPTLDLFKVREVRNKSFYPSGLCQQGSFDRNGKEFDNTIKKVLNAVFRGQSTPTGLLEFATKKDEKGSNEYFGFKDGLFLLPGDKDLHHALESRMQQARSNAQQRGQESSFWVLGGFRKALQDIGRTHNIEYMVCDFGPSAGVMNETLVGSCDYILPTFHADFFSASSVYGLLHSVIPSIIVNRQEMAEVEARNLPATDGYQPFRFNQSAPRLLPFLMTGFQFENVDKRPCVVIDDAHFFDLVTEIVEDTKVPPEVKQLYLKDGSGKMVIPFLRYVPIIQRTSQSLGHPAIGLSPDFIKVLLRERILQGQAPRGMPAEFLHVRIAYTKLAKLVRHHCVPRV